jgi:hypothetical protein
MSYSSVTFHQVTSVELDKTVWENGQAYLTITVKDHAGDSLVITLYAQTSGPFDVLCPDKEEAT